MLTETPFGHAGAGRDRPGERPKDAVNSRGVET